MLPGSEVLPETLVHALAVKTARDGEPLVYYAGSGWSKGGIEHMEPWQPETADFTAALAEPLEVRVIR